MKKLFVVVFIFFSSQLAIAQESKSASIEQKDSPFVVIENPPTYPGCSGTRQDKKNCLEKSLRTHVAKNFNDKFIKRLKLDKGQHKIYVQFQISKTGEIRNIKAKGPHKKLEKEGVRVVKLLPKMIPGKQRGRTIGVNYMLPIAFIVD